MAKDFVANLIKHEEELNFSSLEKFLESKNEGVHHIALLVDSLEFEINRLEGLGFQFISKTPKEGADNKRIVFLHPKSTNGVLVELCEEI